MGGTERPAEEAAATTYIALLRAVNVGGRRPVAMADLRALLAGLGLSDVRSLLQSGNLLFRTHGHRGAELERILEAEAGERLSLETDFFVRTAVEWSSLVAHNPFPREAREDPARLVVMALKIPPQGKDVRALEAAIVGREALRADGRHLYVVYPDGMGRSRLTNAIIERKLETRATARNWNTVLKLATLAAP